uniref:Uncharacterized protein n=1 Tax=uncultured marine virus TaxID=186617 RepID=A0A0F7L1Q7_9VIRU|nr:hypothetical protein [uncultured marine virus]
MAIRRGLDCSQGSWPWILCWSNQLNPHQGSSRFHVHWQHCGVAYGCRWPERSSLWFPSALPAHSLPWQRKDI